MTTPASTHRFVRPGQVAPDLPAPDACMKCGLPEASHSQQDSMMTLLSTDIAQATQIAEAMNANPEASRDGHPWTMQDVIGLALARGLSTLRNDYLSGSRS